MKTLNSTKTAAVSFTLAVLLLAGCSAARYDGPLEEGDKAPDFTLSTVDGRTVTLSGAISESDGVVLWFSNLCSGCQEKMPAVQDIYVEYEGKVEILAVSQLGNDLDSVREAVVNYRLTFPFLVDPDGEVTRLYGNEYVPGSCPLKNILFIDHDMTIKETTHYPGLSDTELKDRIDGLIKED